MLIKLEVIDARGDGDVGSVIPPNILGRTILSLIVEDRKERRRRRGRKRGGEERKVTHVREFSSAVRELA